MSENQELNYTEVVLANIMAREKQPIIETEEGPTMVSVLQSRLVDEQTMKQNLTTLLHEAEEKNNELEKNVYSSALTILTTSSIGAKYALYDSTLRNVVASTAEDAMKTSYSNVLAQVLLTGFPFNMESAEDGTQTACVATFIQGITANPENMTKVSELTSNDEELYNYLKENIRVEGVTSIKIDKEGKLLDRQELYVAE